MEAFTPPPSTDGPNTQPEAAPSPVDEPSPTKDRYWVHILLFLAAVLTCSLVGAELVTNQTWMSFGVNEAGDRVPLPPEMVLGWKDLFKGLPYALAFLGFLTVHELGHYFTARRLRVPTSLPYYLPVYLPFFFNIGSLGAVIRLRGIPESRRKMFAIGVAGPIAGFVVALGLLVWGFTHLPEPEYVLQLHPEYVEDFGRLPTDSETIRQYALPANEVDSQVRSEASQKKQPLFAVGTTLLFEALKPLADPARLPNRFEIMHYPLIWAGFLGLFFTALNLLPIGQLDGGHVVYGLFGRKRAGLVARLTVLSLLFYGGLGLIDFASPYWNLVLGGYLLFLAWLSPRILATRNWRHVAAFLGVFVGLQLGVQVLLGAAEANPLWLIWSALGVRFIGLNHPRAADEQPLTQRERWLGYLAIVLFVLCFTPEPLYLVYNEVPADAILSIP